MAQAQSFEASSTVFPEEAPAVSVDELQLVDSTELRQRLARCLPVTSLLDWLRAEYPHLNDATLLRLYHELLGEADWQIAQSDQRRSTELNTLNVIHYPHGIFP
jgi:hypothetical protein